MLNLAAFSDKDKDEVQGKNPNRCFCCGISLF